MKSHNTISYNSNKDIIIKKYPALSNSILNLEYAIVTNPASGIKETLLIDNRHITTRKREIKTNLFSDRLPDHYLYLTINYGLTDIGDVIFLTIYLHDYSV